MPEVGNRSLEEIGLMREFVKRLGKITKGCAECFPYEMIDELKAEYSRFGGMIVRWLCKMSVLKRICVR